MRVQITARHCEVPDAVLDRTRAQMEALSKYHPRASAVDVVYEEEKVRRTVEVIVHIDAGEPIVAQAEADEFRTALDQVVERLRRRLRRQRERGRDHKAPPLSEGIEE